MEDNEYYDLTERIMEKLAPRIPEDRRDLVDLAEMGGEYAYVVENLVYAVVNYRIPVSHDELEALRALAGDHRDGGELLSKLDGVQPT